MRFGDLVRDGENGDDVLVQNELEFLDGVVVGRVGGDDFERVSLEIEGEHQVFAGDRLGYQFDDGLGYLQFVQVDELHAVEFGDGRHHFRGRGVAHLRKHVLELQTLGVRGALGLLKLVRAHDFLADEDVSEVAALLGHERAPEREELRKIRY